jgi:hypothetical protein
MMMRVKGTFEQCAPQKTAACFTYVNRLDKGLTGSCQPTFKACLSQRSFIVQDNTEYEDVSDCAAYE